MPDVLDPRLTPARPDVAADFLKGKVDAGRFVKGQPRQVTRSRAPLTARSDAACPLSTELLFGETFTVYDEAEGWAWGQAAVDGYVGYVPLGALGRGSPPTHRISALSSHVYPEPDLKSRPVDALYMTSTVSVAGGNEKGFAPLAGGGWISARHLSPVGMPWGAVPDIAKQFLGAPYLWGGRTVAGIDCSGLVQIALAAAGITCPRDTDMQANALEPRLPPDTPPEAGDIVYFPAHVGFMVDETNLLHANATHMAVTIDPLSDVIEIIAGETDKPPVTCLIRM